MSKKSCIRQKIVNAVNVPKLIALHLFGKHHTNGHRMFIGIAMGVVGVVVSKSAPETHTYLLSLMYHIGFDWAGYLIHGMGCVPFIDYFISKAEALADASE